MKNGEMVPLHFSQAIDSFQKGEGYPIGMSNVKRILKGLILGSIPNSLLHKDEKAVAAAAYDITKALGEEGYCSFIAKVQETFGK